MSSKYLCIGQCEMSCLCDTIDEIYNYANIIAHEMMCVLLYKSADKSRVWSNFYCEHVCSAL